MLRNRSNSDDTAAFASIHGRCPRCGCNCRDRGMDTQTMFLEVSNSVREFFDVAPILRKKPNIISIPKHIHPRKNRNPNHNTSFLYYRRKG